MKKLAFCLFAIICAIAASRHQKTIEADRIVVGGLVIETSGDGHTGIWFREKQGDPMIAIFQVGGQTGVGVYGPKLDGRSMIFMTVDDSGPSLQLTHEGKTEILDMKRLRKHPR